MIVRQAWLVGNKLRAAWADPTSRRSIWSLIGVSGRAVFSLLALIALAKALGTSGYGTYAGVAAYAALISPLSTLGIGDALVQHVSRDRGRINSAWGQVLLSGGTAGIALLVLFMVAARVFLDVDIWAILLISMTEFVGMGLLTNHMRASMALDRYAAVAVHAIADGLARMAATAVFWAMGSDDLRVLGALMFLTMMTASVVSGLWLWGSIGPPVFKRRDLPQSIREGLPFTVSQTSGATQANVDKVMMVAYGKDLDNGIYAAGFRVVSYSMMPMMALFSATLPDFFREGEGGVGKAFAYAKEVSGRVFAAAALAGVGSIAAAPFAAWLLADQFSGVVPVVAVFMAYPALKGMQFLVGDSLTGSGYQLFRARSQVGIAVLNVAMNLYAIPAYSWKGAAATTYISELGFVIVLWIGFRRFRAAEADNTRRD